MIAVLKSGANPAPNDRSLAFVRAMLLLLESLALNAVEYDREEIACFQDGIRTLARGLETAKTHSDVLVLTGEAIRAVQSYNRAVEKHIRTARSETQSIIAMMTEALLKVFHSSRLAGENLRLIEREIKCAAEVQDIKELKGKLSTSLKLLCEEAERQELQTSQLGAQLTDREPRNEAAIADPVTGLPGSAALLHYLKDRIGAGKTGYAIAIRLERLSMINARFGYEAGTKVLNEFHRDLAVKLAPGDRLFSWRGPNFAITIERTSGVDSVRAEVLRMVPARVEKSIEVGSRAILLSINSISELIVLSQLASVGEFKRKMEAFADSERKVE